MNKMINAALIIIAGGLVLKATAGLINYIYEEKEEKRRMEELKKESEKIDKQFHQTVNELNELLNRTMKRDSEKEEKDIVC